MICPGADKKKFDGNDAIRIVVTQVQERFACGDFDAELLGELPKQRPPGGLSGKNLAAGKLPQAVERAAANALSDQYPVRGIAQNAGRDIEMVHVRAAS